MTKKIGMLFITLFVMVASIASVIYNNTEAKSFVADEGAYPAPATPYATGYPMPGDEEIVTPYPTIEPTPTMPPGMCWAMTEDKGINIKDWEWWLNYYYSHGGTQGYGMYFSRCDRTDYSATPTPQPTTRVIITRAAPSTGRLIDALKSAVNAIVTLIK